MRFLGAIYVRNAFALAVYSAPPDLQAGFKGPGRAGEEGGAGEGWKGAGKEMGMGNWGR